MLTGGSFQHAQLIELLQPVLHLLPDLKTALNGLDEPRIVPYYNESHAPVQSDAPTQAPHFTEQSHRPAWSQVTLSCDPESPARADLINATSEAPWPSLISNLTESQDICRWPATAGRRHGFLASPSTLYTTENLVPILSTGKLSTFSDIMLPSSYYFSEEIASYHESEDTPWEQK